MAVIVGIIPVLSFQQILSVELIGILEQILTIIEETLRPYLSSAILILLAYSGLTRRACAAGMTISRAI